jgi:HD superfamily phosphodiesterase
MKRAGCGQPIIEHCIGVTRIALELAEELRRRGMEIDMRLVEAGGHAPRHREMQDPTQSSTEP